LAAVARVAPVTAAVGMHPLTAVAAAAAPVAVPITVTVPVAPMIALLRTRVAIPIPVAAPRMIAVPSAPVWLLRARRGRRRLLARGRPGEPAEQSTE